LSEVDISTAGLAVSLRGVTKVYDSGVMALGPLDLDVRKGEFVSLLGRRLRKVDGLRLIAGLNAPTSAASAFPNLRSARPDFHRIRIPRSRR